MTARPAYSDFIVYADESGDHGLKSIDPHFPVFALTFCVFAKSAYMSKIVPSVEALKFRYWGHDSVILHEHDIRKSKGPFAVFMTDRDLRAQFHNDVSRLVADAPMRIFAAVIDKLKLRKRYADPWNPYRIALYFCMERLHSMLCAAGQKGRMVHVVFESRGAREDSALELEFRRIADNSDSWGDIRKDFRWFRFVPVFASKATNSSGLQIADLTARPIALSHLRPDQPKRAFDIARTKIEDLKCFP